MNFPKITVIMRDYTIEQATLIAKLLVPHSNLFAIEVTANTKDAFRIIEHLNNLYGDQLKIGAGTIITLNDAKKAVEAKSQFILAPRTLSQETISFVKKHQLTVVAAAMTPSEMDTMFTYGADIVKIFPAGVVGPSFFKDVQGPFHGVSLMAVGGVSKENFQDYFEAGADFVGIGSSMFVKDDLAHLNEKNLQQQIEDFIKVYEGEV